MDYPQAWEITRASKMEYHHRDCSWREGMLCDCDVLYRHPEYLTDYQVDEEEADEHINNPI